MTEIPEKQQATKLSVSLYPRQDTIVKTYALETRRPYSNALQFIIEDWAALRNRFQEPEPARPEAAA